ncbi:hypothetical protein CTM91_03445 [Photobacterium aquimaris]|uniref:DUF2607 domain-containing protein n=2 Tax=Vibrionaceae TaxID=641 RepID=A0A2T3IGM3_9GAMM|nr:MULTISPECIES: hypothetical protein [Photobacterium]PSU26125.1 hypothetical protein CTM88_16805 [Photobacterium aquimaris]PSW02512.1 hypothetical protein CTM91_03445 [Photobacterium aquimaris]
MRSQSISAQLLRMALLLAVTLVAVHHCQPLLDALATNATSGGCHQQNSVTATDKPIHCHQHEQ